MEIPGFDRAALVDGLSRQLADICTLRLKTEGCYWNGTDMIPGKLHPTLLLQYAALGAAANEIAECIRDLGAQVPCSCKQFCDLARISEDTGAPSGEQMISQLTLDHETMTKNAITLVLVAKEADYSAPVDLLKRQTRMHQKAAQTLRNGDSVVFLD